MRLGESENKLQAAQKALQAKAEQCEREVNNLHRHGFGITLQLHLHGVCVCVCVEFKKRWVA